ncbi:MAG: hypothetical protein M0Z81_05840 [Deltaproteobacteria bacterium]|nr:hypothetical protein [Deltaproteobacteria bacterium]
MKAIRRGVNFPFTRSWVYKQIQLKRYPGLFLKIGGALFVDLD